MSGYDDVQARLARGWNTFDTRSLLTQVLLPEGLAVALGIKEYYRGNALHQVQIGRRDEDAEEVTLGPHAVDGAYAAVTVRWRGIELHVETAHAGEDLVILVTPRANQAQPATLTVSAGPLWNLPGAVRRAGEVLEASLPGRDTPLTIHTTAAQVDDPYVDLTGPYLAVRLHGPVGVSTGQARDLAQIEAVVAAGRERLRPAPAGTDAEHRDLIRDAIAWNTVYEPAGRRVVTTVSRLWNVGKRGGYALFCWDNYFNALLAGLFSTDLAYANAVEMTRALTPDGFVPNVAQGTGRRTYDGSQPPVGALVALQLYRSFGERWFLEEVYPGLLSWNRWWWRVRRDGDLLCLGSTAFEPQWPSPQDIPRINQHFGATCESGCDDHPVFADIPYDPQAGLLRAHDIGLNSEYAMDCAALADIAETLGNHAERDELRARGAAVAASVERTLWQEDTESYRSRRTDTGAYTREISPMSFYPLLAGIGADGRAARTVRRYLRDERYFGGRWAIPSTPRTDTESASRSYYWKGRVWPPMNFLVYLGLRRAGLTEERRWLAERSADVAMKEWHEARHVHENYSAGSGEGCDKANSEPFHSWGALLSLIPLIERGDAPYFQEGS
ncbi:trehalase family glycosidase [Dactylosporangium sp. AC04546]|uniref:alpha,alpha-trehalase n=1 Tax=Dactylosporangium sp. AC04546 TaxID=2862460 RepID=UPI001EDDBB50|nr:alpha,alpha-trehalase [Dactylosporangium sp. AC04546]WVK81136.1 trehalase family glycosidase [Dactylosporangium sp. AC04546]